MLSLSKHQRLLTYHNNLIMKLPHNYSVYIVQCRDESYYVGVTNDLDRRLWEHNSGFNIGCYTYMRKPVVLKYYETTHDIKQAILREKQLKGCSRKKKEALFEEDWNELIRLSRSTVEKLKDEQSATPRQAQGDPSTGPG